MNKFEIKYQGNLRTTATHLDSGSVIDTDAPKDNHGLGEAFSPTDMVCSAFASCILTIMAIAVEKNGININGTNAIVKKIMGANHDFLYNRPLGIEVMDFNRCLSIFNYV